MQVLFEDNHIIAVNKAAGDLVQGDKTGDEPLPEKVKRYLKEKYNKPGNVFLGVTHRLDRPTTGVLLFARTSKALTRLNAMFKNHDYQKTYWALVEGKPNKKSDELDQYLLKNEQKNKSMVVSKDRAGAKRAQLSYRTLKALDNYTCLEVDLKTGRHHQIRCQLSHIGHPIKGDLKYGSKRSNPDGSISLHARSISFTHPVSKEHIKIIAPTPKDNLWDAVQK